MKITSRPIRTRRERLTTTIPTTSFVQTYNYDAIARLTEAREKTGPTTNWQQTFGYDIFGNRTSLSQSMNGNSIPNTNINHPTIDWRRPGAQP